jgi:DNA-binding GntR family transcriptional regulator
MGATLGRTSKPATVPDANGTPTLDGAPNEYRPGRRQWVSMVDIAYDALLEGISDRRLAPGSRLDIRDLASGLEMSPTPVREALARLASAGLLTLDANRGYRIAPVLTSSEYHQLFAARRVIELGAIQPQEWLETVTDQQVSKIVRIERLAGSSAHGPRYADYAEFNRADAQLHESILATTGNPFLGAAWSRLNCHLHLSRLYAGRGVIDFDHACIEHAAIVEAVAGRDHAALLAAYELHLRRAETRLEELV